MTASAGDTFSSSSIAARKTALRSQLRATRKAIPLRRRRHAARAAALRLLRGLRGRRHVALYLSVHSELSTGPLIAALRRRDIAVYAPVAREGLPLRFVPLRVTTPLIRGRLGLPQPVTTRGRRPLRRLDAVVLPLLGFDVAGGRLGNGGGYYDRTLARRGAQRRPRLIGYAYTAQQVDALPREPWDVALDAVVTERGIIRCHPKESTR